MAEQSKETKAVTKLSQISDRFMGIVTQQFETAGIKMDEYSKQCGIHAIMAINSTVEHSGANWGEFDQSNVQSIIETVAALKLNASATPREVYFIVRKEKKADGTWGKKLEYGIEGDGNDAILRHFGVDVKTVYTPWIVRAKDVFEYPKHVGLQLTPPEWTESGEGPIVRIVYPIQHKDGTVEYKIAERSDVINNLLAHIRNNLMNETFGIAKSRYDATPDQKAKIDAKKSELLKKAKELGFDVLNATEFEPYISPAWLDATEAMFIRKMRNNVVKKYPKDFGSAYISDVYESATDETYSEVKKEIAENAGAIPVDFEETDTKEEIKPDPAPSGTAQQAMPGF